MKTKSSVLFLLVAPSCASKYFRNWSTACIAGSILLLVAGQSRAEYLINGGAEDGDLSVGWNAVPDNCVIRQQLGQPGDVHPYQGDWMWSFDVFIPSANAEIWQTGTTGLDSTALLLMGQVHTLPDYPDRDFGVATLSFLDSNATTIATASTGNLAGRPWTPFEIAVAVPSNASMWKVTISGTRIDGFVITAYFDELSLSASMPDADFDGDADVDGDDFLAWQGGFGTLTGAQKSDGDYDNDGDVDGDDFLGWQSEFGSGIGTASAAVPEPVSVVQLIAAAASVIFLAQRHFRGYRS